MRNKLISEQVSSASGGIESVICTILCAATFIVAKALIGNRFIALVSPRTWSVAVLERRSRLQEIPYQFLPR